MFEPSIKTVILITLLTLVSACGPAASPVPPTATTVSAAPTAVSPTAVAISSPAAVATPVPPTNAAVLPAITNTPVLDVISVDIVDQVDLLLPSVGTATE